MTKAAAKRAEQDRIVGALRIMTSTGEWPHGVPGIEVARWLDMDPRTIGAKLSGLQAQGRVSGAFNGAGRRSGIARRLPGYPTDVKLYTATS